MMRRIRYGIKVCMVLLVGAWLGMAEAEDYSFNDKGEVVQRAQNGTINYSAGVISAVGTADPDQSAYAQGVAAEANARANLLMVLNEINIKRGITVEQGKLTKDINIQTIEGKLRSWVDPPKKEANGTISVRADTKLTPELIREIMPEEYFKPDEGDKPFVAASAPATSTSQAPEAVPVKPYTGLIIDGSGLGISPSLGFKVVVEDTEEVLYGLSTVSRTAVIKAKGMAGYARTVEDARKNYRVGKNPLVVKADGAIGDRNTDVSITRENAAKIYAANLEKQFLKDLKVIVVCGG